MTVLPLSPLQQQLWLLEQIEAEPALYNTIVTVRLRGPVDRNLLERALDAVVRRHSLLHSVVALGPDFVPHFAVAERAAVLDEVARLAGETWQEAALRYALQPFRMHGGLLWRCGVVPDGRDSILVAAIHHAITDGTSNERFVADLQVAYEMLANGVTPAWKSSPPEYHTVADAIGAAVSPEAIQYWRTALSKVQFAAAERDAPSTRHAQYCEVALSSSERKLLEACAARDRVTPFIALAAATAYALSRCGQRDVVLITPSANRRTAGSEEVFGPLADVFPIPVQCAGASYRSILTRVRGTLLDALDHGFVPFDVLLRELRSNGVATGNVASNWIVLRQEAAPVRTGDVVWAFENVAWPKTRYPLGFAYQRAVNGTLSLRLCYDGGSLEPGSARTLAETVLRSLRTYASEEIVSA